MSSPISLVVLAVLYLLAVLASATWLPSVARMIFGVGLAVLFLRASWLFGTWNPSSFGWRRIVVMLVGGLVTAGAVGFVTVAILFELLPMLGYRE